MNDVTATLSRTSSIKGDVILEFLFLIILVFLFIILPITLIKKKKTTQNDANGSNATTKSNSVGSGLFKSLIVVAFIIIAIFLGIKLFESRSFTSPKTTTTNNDGATKLLSRSATVNDIIIEDELDMNNFGAKFIIYPQYDISNLKLTIKFYDKNYNLLKTMVKNIGNVKEGVQVSFSISIADLGLSTSLKATNMSYTVSGGTISYFG